MKPMKLLKLKPHDNTFFRDGNRFDFETHRLIQSKNIPYPSTFFGAIFTAMLSENQVFKNKFFKEANYDHEEILTIGQIYLYNEEQDLVYIPAPKDFFINQRNECALGAFVKADRDTISLDYPYYFREPEGEAWERADGYYVWIKEFFERYKARNFDIWVLENENKIFTKSLKIGLSKSKTNQTAEESRLYSIEQTEFCDNRENSWAYIVEYDMDTKYLRDQYNLGNESKNGLELGNGYLKLGGENKVCEYGAVNENIETAINTYREKSQINGECIKENINESHMIKVIFTSDSYFDRHIKEIFDGEMSLVGIINDKPLYIGGYDMRKGNRGSIRTMYKGYSAGTVLLLEKGDMTADQVKKYLENKIKKHAKGFNQYICLGENEYGEG